MAKLSKEEHEAKLRQELIDKLIRLEIRPRRHDCRGAHPHAEKKP